MQTNEQTGNRQENGERRENGSCCGMPSQWRMRDCCESMWRSDDGRSMMSRCMTMCRWFPLVPVVLGIAMLLMGYYIDAEVTRMIWMFIAGSMVLLGTLGLIMAGRMKKMCC